jgi:hypothetical protein
MLLKNRRVRQCTTARSLFHIKIESIVSSQSQFRENEFELACTNRNEL